METLSDVLAELRQRGSEQTCKTYARHGINLPMFGVSVADLKVVAKRLKGRHEFALELFDTGNYDAMYLAGMIADGRHMSKQDLNRWAKSHNCEVLCGSTVPAVASESPYARELALKWIDSKKPTVAICGWGTYGGIVATRADDELDFDEIQLLLKRVVEGIADAPNRVRYAMNQFVIAVGAYVKPLLPQAKRAARALGVVEVDMGDTACKTPVALAYIEKIESMGRVGKKRKTMKC